MSKEVLRANMKITRNTMKRRALTKKRRKDAGSVKTTREGWKRTWHYQSFRRLLIITRTNLVVTPCVHVTTLKSALPVHTELCLYSNY